MLSKEKQNIIPEYVAIENHPNLKRDTRSMLVLNCDPSGKNRFHIQKQRILKEKQLYENRINKLETDVIDLKSLVEKLLENKII